MRHRILPPLFLILLVCLSCARERKRERAFQGLWFKSGYDTPAFVVRGDSMYHPGLDAGYYYELDADTLRVHYSEREVEGVMLSFSSQRLKIWDISLSQDTILLSRRPTPHDSLE